MSNHRMLIDKPDEGMATAAIEGAQDGMWDLDFTSDRIYLSRRWKALLGFNVSDLSDDPTEWFSRIHKDDHSQVKKLLKKHLEGKTAHFRSEHRIQHANGSYRWFLVRGAKVHLAQQSVSRIAGTITDIHERKNHEHQLLQQLDELRFALASEKVLMDELDRKNRELTELSITDGLTGLFNHRYLQDRFDYEFKRVRRYGGMLSCIIIDIDHFKSLNDTYGHQYGDYVIRQIATLIKTRSREVDICGRYGGEEFMVISNLHEKNALLYATKLHDTIEKYVFEHPTASVNVTVSIGIAEYNSEVRSKQELIERADRAMYQAKNSGRNMVCIWRNTQLTDEHSVDSGDVVRFRERFRDMAVEAYTSWMDASSEVVNAVERNIPYAPGHAEEVSKIAVSIAETMNLSREQIEIVRLGAFLHDIGKCGIPEVVVNARSPLSKIDAAFLGRHPDIGVAMLKEIKFLERELPVILYHHERFDGKGYPHHLRGREIPVEARIVAVADAVDTKLNGRRSGRKCAMVKVHEMLHKGRGTLYCPDVCDAFEKQTDLTGNTKESTL